MSLFGRKTKVELSPESRELIAELLAEITTFNELAEEINSKASAVMGVIENDTGVKVFDEETPTLDTVVENDKHTPKTDFGGKPSPFKEKEFETSVSNEDRRRSSPFTRIPRHVQAQWLLEVVMVNGDWIAPIEVAREYATDERHFRYLRHAISGRMREMWEEGKLERRDSMVRGNFYEFRIKNGTNKA